MPPLTPLGSQVQQRSQFLCSSRFRTGGQVWQSKVSGLFQQVRKQRRRVGSFPRGVAQRSGRGAGMPLVPRRTDFLVLPYLSLSVKLSPSQCCDGHYNPEQLREKRSFGSPSQPIIEESQGRNSRLELKQQLWRNAAHRLLPVACLVCFLGPQAPVTDSASWRPVLPTSVIHQESAPQTCLKAVRGNGYIFSIKDLLP